MNPKWNRWIVASLNKHFSAISDASFQLIIENQRPRDFDNLTMPVFEPRIDGPWFRQQTKNEWVAFAPVDILIQCPIQVGNKVNLYDIHDLAGKIVARAAIDVEVFSYGETTPAHIGCMSRTNNEIRVSHYGKQGTAERVLHTTVEFAYAMELSA
jgi:hypothetical protein